MLLSYQQQQLEMPHKDKVKNSDMIVVRDWIIGLYFFGLSVLVVRQAVKFLF